MREQLMLTGMVLSAMPIGEFDKRVLVLTRERGKITAFAKGARRQNSNLLAAANPFVFGSFFFYEGRSAYSMVQAEVQNYFHELSMDFEGACYGSYFMEFADYYARENSDESQMLSLLYVSLRALLNRNLKKELVRYVFELRAMMINGEYPQVFSCIFCESGSQPLFFVPEKNGVVCAGCLEKTGGKRIRLEGSTVYALQYVISSPIEKLYTFKLSDKIFLEFQSVIDEFRRRYIDKSFKSLEILKSIQNY